MSFTGIVFIGFVFFLPLPLNFFALMAIGLDIGGCNYSSVAGKEVGLGDSIYSSSKFLYFVLVSNYFY